MNLTGIASGRFFAASGETYGGNEQETRKGL
jgi:hypothetical protein